MTVAPRKIMPDLELYRERLRQGLLDIALKWGQGVDRAGNPVAWLIDSRELLLQGRYLHYASRLLWERLKPYGLQVVGGFTLAAHPLAVGILYESQRDDADVEVVLIRREPKENGLRRQIEGPPLSAQCRLGLVDDLVNSGDTQRGALDALQKCDVDPLVVAVIVDYQKGGTEWLRQQGIAVETLFTLADLGLAPPVVNAPAAIAEKWTVPLNSGAYFCPKSSPVANGEALFVGSDRGFLCSLGKDGVERWRYGVRDKERGIHSTPYLCGGRVFFGAYDGYFYCLDCDAGQLVWETRPGQWIGSSASGDEAAGLVYVGVEYGEKGGSLVALDAKTGRQRWEAQTQHYVHSAPFFDAPRQQVIFGSNDGWVRALDGNSGKPRWRSKTGAAIKSGVTVDAQGTCFVTSMDGFLYSFCATSGKPGWKKQLGDRLYFDPLCSENLVIVGGFSGRLIACRKDSGSVRWIASFAGAPFGGAALAGGCIVLGTLDGGVHAVALQEGELLWSEQRGKGPVGRPLVLGEHFYLPCGDGALVCYGGLEPSANSPTQSLSE